MLFDFLLQLRPELFLQGLFLVDTRHLKVRGTLPFELNNQVQNEGGMVLRNAQVHLVELPYFFLKYNYFSHSRPPFRKWWSTANRASGGELPLADSTFASIN